MSFLKFNHQLSFKCSQQELISMMEKLMEESLKSKVYGIGFSKGEYVFFLKRTSNYKVGLIYFKNTEPVMYAKVKSISSTVQNLHFYSKMRVAQQFIILFFPILLTLFIAIGTSFLFIPLYALVSICIYLIIQIGNNNEAADLVETLKYRIAKMLLEKSN